jgi:transcription antitermination factor NusG
MPILKREADLFPEHLFDGHGAHGDGERLWWSFYTRSRREKDLMRKLRSQGIAHYSPMIGKRFRSPKGRVRESFLPLFPNYVFMLGSEADRTQALMTDCISRSERVANPESLVVDLRRIHAAISTGEPMTPEARLEAGQSARVRSGPFRGLEGIVIRREGKTRFLLSVRYLEQGVSMEIDEGLLEPL